MKFDGFSTLAANSRPSLSLTKLGCVDFDSGFLAACESVSAACQPP